MKPCIPRRGPVPFSGFKMTGGNRPTLMTEVSAADIVVAQNSQSHSLAILKNKWGLKGNDIDLQKFSYIVGRMIAQKFFSGLHNMFQEGMAQDIQKAIEEIIEKYQPKEKKRKRFYDNF